MHVQPDPWSLTATTDDGGSPSASAQHDALQEMVAEAVATYLRDLGDAVEMQGSGRLYRLLLERVELPLLQTVLAHVQQNQTRAARILGLNRGTLRKKMQQHGLLGK